jgi:predicted metal-binding protein
MEISYQWNKTYQYSISYGASQSCAPNTTIWSWKKTRLSWREYAHVFHQVYKIYSANEIFDVWTIHTTENARIKECLA